MIIHLLQHIIFMIIVRVIIIALVTQMTVHHHLQIQEDVMAAVAGEIKKSPFMQRAFYDLR
ncbi:histidine kinase [Acinetobacter pittii]|uniref:histidine kinase n=1 Tax=Acinetobacter pittii TaxID=48296 RepID=UPI001E2AB9B6|nr:histidine kinase [Acinetobacter pittii]